jgi:AraC-like DNA-binding protein
MPQLTVTTTETNTRWTITPQGRAALDAASAPTHAFLPEVLHGLAPDTYAHAYATGWHAHAAGEDVASPHWGGPLEVAYEDGYLDHQRDPDRPWVTALFGFEAACDHAYSLDTYRARVGRREHAHDVATRGQRYAQRVTARVGWAIHDSGVPAAEVASKAGMSASTLRRRLAGHTSFTPSEVMRVALVLDLDVLSFFHNTEETNR